MAAFDASNKLMNGSKLENTRYSLMKFLEKDTAAVFTRE
jgi:hypothetical protein